MIVIFLFSCNSGKGKKERLAIDPIIGTETKNGIDSVVENSVNEENEVDEKKEDENKSEDKDLIHYDSYNYTKTFKEEVLEKGPSHILDFRNRDNDKFIGIKFSDGHSGTLVLRDGKYFNYTIREKTEVCFASKEDGLQRIWDNSRLIQNVGGAISSSTTPKSGPLKKDGTPDRRYKANRKLLHK